MAAVVIAAAEMLGDGDDVGDDAFGFEGEHLAELAEPGLLLIDDQQHAARVAHLVQPLQPAARRLHHAAGAEQRLRDDGGRPAGGLCIQQREACGEAGEITRRKSLRERTAITIGRHHRRGAAGQRAVAGVPAGEGHRARRVRQAVEADMRAGDLVAAGIFARDHHRHFVGVRSGLAEQAFLQRRGHDLPQPRGEFDFAHVVVAAMGVQHRVAGIADRGDDRGVVVAEGRAHLARVEIQELLPGDIGHRGVLGAGEYGAGCHFFIHARAEGVFRRLVEQGGLGVVGLRHGGGGSGWVRAVIDLLHCRHHCRQ